MTTRNIIRQYALDSAKILGKHLLQVILYGSYARGDYHEDSDIDILFITNLSESEQYDYLMQLSDLAFEYEMRHGVHISPVIENDAKYTYWRDTLPFFINVEKEGVAII